MKNIILIFLIISLKTDAQTQNEISNAAIETFAAYLNDELKSVGKSINKIRDGEWVWYYESGEVFQKMNYADGHSVYGEQFFNNGQIASKGEYRINELGEDVQHGRWNYYFTNGILRSTINWKLGVKDGEIIEYSESTGIIANKFNYFGGVKNGSATWYYEDGSIRREVHYINDKLDLNRADWPLLYPDNSINFKELRDKNGKEANWSETVFFNGKLFSGTAFYYSENGTKLLEGNFMHGLYEGYFSEYDDTGKLISKKLYNKGKLLENKEQSKFSKCEGTRCTAPKCEAIVGLTETEMLDASNQRWKYTLNPKSKLYYQNKEFTGIVKKCGDNGLLKSKINLVNGVFHGEALMYSDNGQLMVQMYFQNGSMNGETFSYLENGQLIANVNYKMGLNHGDFIRYWENGNLETKQIYFNGELNGERVDYYENGNIRIQGTYINGNKHGVWIKMNPNGILVNKEFWSDGDLKSCEGDCN